MHLTLRLCKGLPYYFFLGKEGRWSKTEEDFLPIGEIEAALSASARCSVLVRLDKSHTDTLVIEAKKWDMIKLCEER